MKDSNLSAAKAISVGDAGEVPVGVGDHGVAHVGGQRQHRLIDVYPLVVPEHHPTNHHRVPQVVDARTFVSAAVDPAQLIAQTDEDPMHLAEAQGTPPAPAPRADEEWHLLSELDMDIAQPPIPIQRLHHARMQRHMARLGELGLPNGEQA